MTHLILAQHPAGYIGYPIRNYQANSNTSVANPFYINQAIQHLKTNVRLI